MTSCSHYEGIWYVADSGELLTIGDHLAFIQYLDDLTVSLICRDHHALIELAAWLTEQCVWLGEQLPDVGSGRGQGPRIWRRIVATLENPYRPLAAIGRRL